MKLYYGAIAMLWLLYGCTPSSNVVDDHKIIGTSRSGDIRELVINEHSYYRNSYWCVHAGDCKKCKQELDSIVRIAVKEVLECR